MEITNQLKQVELYDNVEEATEFLKGHVPLTTFANHLSNPSVQQVRQNSAIPLKYMADERQQEFEHLIPVSVKSFKFLLPDHDDEDVTRTIMASPWLPFCSSTQFLSIYELRKGGHHQALRRNPPPPFIMGGVWPIWGVYVHEGDIPAKKSIIDKWYTLRAMPGFRQTCARERLLNHRAGTDYGIRETLREIDLSESYHDLFIVNYQDFKVIPITYQPMFRGYDLLCFATRKEVGFCDSQHGTDWEIEIGQLPEKDSLYESNLRRKELYDTHFEEALENMNDLVDDRFLTGETDIQDRETYYEQGSYEELKKGLTNILYAYLPTLAWYHDGHSGRGKMDLILSIEAWCDPYAEGGTFREDFDEEVDPYKWFYQPDLLNACDLVLKHNTPLGWYWENYSDSSNRESGWSACSDIVNVHISPPTSTQVLEAREWCAKNIEYLLSESTVKTLKQLACKKP